MICCTDILQDVGGGADDVVGTILIRLDSLSHVQRVLPCERLGSAYVNGIRQSEILSHDAVIGVVVRIREMTDCFSADATGALLKLSLATEGNLAEVAPFAYLKKYRLLFLMRTPASVRGREFEWYLNGMSEKMETGLRRVRFAFSIQDGLVNGSFYGDDELAFPVNFIPSIPDVDDRHVGLTDICSVVNNPDQMDKLSISPRQGRPLMSGIRSSLGRFWGQGKQDVSVLRSDVSDTELSDICAYPTMRFFSELTPSLASLVADETIADEYFSRVAKYAMEKMKLRERYEP